MPTADDARVPDASGFSRKSSSRSTSCALVPDGLRSQTSSMPLSSLVEVDVLLRTAAFFSFSAFTFSKTKPENSRRLRLTLVFWPARPKHRRCSVLSSSLAESNLPILKTTFSISASFSPAPCSILKSSSFSLTSIVKASTCFFSRFSRPADAGCDARERGWGGQRG